MKVAIHQPNYLPWAGYFHKLCWADTFVFLDHVPFSKGSYQNRVMIGGRGSPMWLTQPVKTKGKLGAPTNDIQFAEHGWKGKHLNTLRTRYGRTPHFREVYTLLEGLFERADDYLASTNEMVIRALAAYLDMTPRFMRSADLEVQGSGTTLLLSICQTLGADHYLSGIGGQRYLDRALFDHAGIKVQFSTFSKTRFSVVDTLFSLGRASSAHIADDLF